MIRVTKTTENELNRFITIVVDNAVSIDNSEARSAYSFAGGNVKFVMAKDGKHEHAIVSGKLRDLLKGPVDVRCILAWRGLALDILKDDEDKNVRWNANEIIKDTTITNELWPSYYPLDQMCYLKMTATLENGGRYDIPILCGPYRSLAYMCKVLNEHFKKIHQEYPNFPLDGAIGIYYQEFSDVLHQDAMNRLERKYVNSFYENMKVLATNPVFISDEVFRIDFMDTLMYAENYSTAEKIVCCKTFEEKLATLKQALFMGGMNAIEDFLGMECPYDDKDMLEKLIDETAMQMSEEKFEFFWERYILSDLNDQGGFFL